MATKTTKAAPLDLPAAEPAPIDLPPDVAATETAQQPRRPVRSQRHPRPAPPSPA